MSERAYEDDIVRENVIADEQNKCRTPASVSPLQFFETSILTNLPIKRHLMILLQIYLLRDGL